MIHIDFNTSNFLLSTGLEEGYLFWLIFEKRKKNDCGPIESVDTLICHHKPNSCQNI